MYVIFDLDQTIIDSSIAYETRKVGNWKKVYDLIPSMKPYDEIILLINALLNAKVKVAIVTSSPETYCTKVLDFLGIKDVITVCFHDTKKHKPDPEPILLAIEKMGCQKYDNIIVIGDEDNDTIAVNKARYHYKNIKSILGCWGHYKGEQDIKVTPTIFCSDEKCLLRYFSAIGLDLGKYVLENREYDNDEYYLHGIYNLFDYYPISREHDILSESILKELKENNNSTTICEAFCRAIIKQFSDIKPKTYGIFVVPSSEKWKWNNKLIDYVVPRLVESLKLIDCSKYIVRYKTRTKQSHGGNRSVESNLATIKLQYELPPKITGAFIIDDITTTGNIFHACVEVICASKQIYMQDVDCIAIGGTVNFKNIYSPPEPTIVSEDELFIELPFK